MVGPQLCASGACSQIVACSPRARPAAQRQLATRTHECVRRQGSGRSDVHNASQKLARKRCCDDSCTREQCTTPNNAASAKPPSRAAAHCSNIEKWRLRRAPRASTDQSERDPPNRLPQQYAGRRRGALRRAVGAAGAVKGRTGASSTTRAHLALAPGAAWGDICAVVYRPARMMINGSTPRTREPVVPSRSCGDEHPLLQNFKADACSSQRGAGALEIRWCAQSFSATPPQLY